MSASPNPYASPNIPDPQQNPFGATGGYPLATRTQRFVGALVDGLIMTPLTFGAGFVLGIGLVVSGLQPESVPFRVAAAVIGLAIGAGIFLAINGYLLATRGQTVGKYLVKTQIVSEGGGLVPFAPLILKRYVPIWVAGQVPFIGPLFLLVNVLAIFRENHKCIHDDLAGTKVIFIGSPAA